MSTESEKENCFHSIGEATLKLLLTGSRDTGQERYVITKLSGGLNRLAKIQTRGIVRNREEPAEIAQAVILSLLETDKREKFESLDHVNRWCCTLIHRYLVDRFRYHKVAARAASQSSQIQEFDITHDRSPLDELTELEIDRAKVIVQYYEEIRKEDSVLCSCATTSMLWEMPNRAIARELGVAESTVSYHIRRAKTLLKRKLEESGFWD